jgi:tRNA pseudouridine38-40 synthase
MRYFILLQYNGTPYHGWQIQPNATTVQETLDQALSRIFHQTIETTGCGRTDTGVHAEQFYAHFELENEIVDVPAVLRKFDSMRLKGISVHSIFPVKDDLHARFSATSRTYEYRIMRKRNPFLENLAHYVYGALDIDQMNAAAKHLYGKQDFSAFSKSNTQVFTDICTVSHAQWEEKGDLFIFTITADRFLRNMVRAIVGTLLDVGYQKIDPSSIPEIIKSGSRSQAGISVPACGLFLTRIEYPFENQGL